jgi:excisionase family DNA binding protein
MVVPPQPWDGENTMPEVAPSTEPNCQSRRHPSKPVSATVNDTCRVTGLGRTKVYELIRAGKLKTVTIGRRRLVLYSSIEELIHRASA